MNMPAHTFLVQFERQLARLKAAFRAPATAEWQTALQQFKQWRRQHQPDDMSVTDFSSLFALPTTQLKGTECTLHRVWLGGSPPPNVILTLTQWQDAIRASHSAFQQTLWVWDAQQLTVETRFVAQPGSDACQLGVLFLPDALVRVNSLALLMQSFDAPLVSVLQQLHEKRYYATLSDFFRLAVLVQYGGVYLDADTLPAQPATLFLCKPELPDYPGEHQQPVNWLNLFVDETGMIIAHQGNSTLQHLLTQLSDVYRQWPLPLETKTPHSERAIFEPFYRLWCEQLQVSQLSHQEFAQRYAVYGFDVPQSRVCGIKGMRLQEDILSGERCALSPEEQQHYQHTVARLAQRNWQLSDPLQLADIAPLFSEQAILSIAYAPQLRAEIPYYHYYGVLSQDPQLDKTNNVFSDYLIALNQKDIAAGDFWQPVTARKKPYLWFKPGVLATATEQRNIAQLLFSTSYLEYCSVDNCYSTDIVTLQLHQNIWPFLRYISTLYDASGNMIGFINAAPVNCYSEPGVEYAYRPDVRPLDEAYDAFVENHSEPDDYFICSVALVAQQQGKGYFDQILCWAIQQAKQQKLRRITLCVWQSNVAARIYRKKGFDVIATLEKDVIRFHDKLLFMALTF